MDREALEHGLVRRLLDHLENRTTDLADGVLELPADVYSGARHDAEVEVLFRGQPLVLCLSGGCRARRRSGPWTCAARRSC